MLFNNLGIELIVMWEQALLLEPFEFDKNMTAQVKKLRIFVPYTQAVHETFVSFLWLILKY